MNNIEELAKDENESARIFAQFVIKMRAQMGSYSRLYESLNSLSTNLFYFIKEEIKRQNFRDDIDVALYLEEI